MPLFPRHLAKLDVGQGVRRDERREAARGLAGVLIDLLGHALDERGVDHRIVEGRVEVADAVALLIHEIGQGVVQVPGVQAVDLRTTLWMNCESIIASSRAA